MQRPDLSEPGKVYELQQLFSSSLEVEIEEVIQSSNFERTRWSCPDQSSFILDKFPNFSGVTCCFARLSSDQEVNLRLIVRGGHELISCPAGGWLLKATTENVSSYWIPQPPVLRTEDALGRILSEETAREAQKAGGGIH